MTSTNSSIKRSGSSGSGGTTGNNVGSTTKSNKSSFINSRHKNLFLKLGLAASVSFHFIWVAKQLSLLGTNNNTDELLISPESFDTSSRSSGSNVGVEGRRRITNSHPFDPRGKTLPLHPHPNAELQELVGTHSKYNCSEGLVYVEDHILPDNITHPSNRKIPYLFHVTSKSRCMTPSFANNIQKWKDTLGTKYSIYIHDDDAVNKFIYEKKWFEFPEFPEIMSCVTAGAAKADIWRYIMIWEYGGIYSDMDSSPNTFNVDSITNEDDAFFPLEKLGIPAQYWFAASPRHPVMYLSAKHSLQTMAFRTDISDNNAAKTTGPGAFKTGFILFQQFKGIDTTGYVDEGIYTGAHDRTVRVVGSKSNENEWIIREGVKGKGGNYEAMGMTRFHDTKGKYKQLHNGIVSCIDQRYKMHVELSADWVNIV